ncbi:phage tail fiber domain-containing protein, partial [Serratia liquefaciens]|uniref:phage tail fiber domain-containing protein n=1 Tax=Serratia liquefaciens TaxID=614 RepID=UPI0021BB3800
MSVPNQTPYNIYTANGLTTVFPYEFYLLTNSDLAVSINGEVLTTGYAVSGVGNVDGGEVTFFTPPGNGTTVLLQREIPSTRLTDYQDNGDLLANTVNKDFDRLWMAIRQAYLYLGFALTRPIWGGPFNAKGYRIENLGYPVNSTDAASKQYVDDAGIANLNRVLRFPESFVSPMSGVGPRSNMLQGYNNLGMPVPIAGQTETADLAIKLSGSFGSQLVGHTDLISKFYFLKDYFDQGYILVSSRDELIAAQTVIKTVMLKRTEIRLARNFSPWTAAQTDIDLAWVTITGHADGTYIDATGIPNVEGNYFIRFYNSGGLDMNGLPFLEGLRFSGVSVKGPSRSSLVDGMLFHSPDHQMGNLTIGYFNIQEFRRGISFQTNAYIIKVMNAYIARCNMAGVDQPAGFSNYGENIALYGCTIAVSGGPAVHINNGNGGFHLHNCSLDYTGQVIVAEAGYVECHGGHHEFENGSNPLTGTPYVVILAQTARIALHGTKIVCIRSAGMTQPYFVR